MTALRKPLAFALILGLGLSQQACIATAAGAVVGTAVGATGAAVGMTAKGAGMVVGAVLPGGKDRDR